MDGRHPRNPHSYYYTPAPQSEETLALMRVIDETFMDCPWYGSRQMARHLQRLGHAVGRRRVRRLMAQMGLVAIYRKRCFQVTSIQGMSSPTPFAG